MLVKRDVAERVDAILSSEYCPTKRSDKLIKNFTQICHAFEELQRQFHNKQSLLWPSVRIWQWYIDEIMVLFVDVLAQLGEKESEIAYYFKTFIVSVQELKNFLSKLNESLQQLRGNVKKFFTEFEDRRLDSTLQATWQKTCHLLGEKNFSYLYSDIVSIKVVMQAIQKYQYVVDVALKILLSTSVKTSGLERVHVAITRKPLSTLGLRVVARRDPSPPQPVRGIVTEMVELGELPSVTRREYIQLREQFGRRERELTEQVATATAKERVIAETLSKERAGYVMRERLLEVQLRQQTESLVRHSQEAEALRIKLTEQVAVAIAKEKLVTDILSKEREEYVIKEQQHREQVQRYEERAARYRKKVELLQLESARERNVHGDALIQQKLVFERQRAVLKSQLESLQAERTTLLQQQSEQEKTKARVSELEQQLIVILTEADSYKKQLAVAKAEAEEYKAQLARERQQHEEECTKLRAAILDLEQEIERAGEEVERYRKEKLVYLQRQIEERQVFSGQFQALRAEHEVQVHVLQAKQEEMVLNLRFAKLQSGGSLYETEEQEAERIIAGLKELPAAPSKLESSEELDIEAVLAEPVFSITSGASTTRAKM